MLDTIKVPHTEDRPDTKRSTRISEQALRHNQMRRAVVDAHPEVRALARPNPYTAFAIPVLLAIHWSIAWLVSDSNLLVVFLVSFFVGQVVIHAAGGLVHETAHRLIFQRPVPKLLFDIGLELVLASFGKQLTYQHEHISSHHRHIGDYDHDYEHEDIRLYETRRAFRRRHPVIQKAVTVVTLAVNLLPLGFLVSEELFPRFYKWITGQPVKDRRRPLDATQPTRQMMALFIAVSLAVNVGLFLAFGVLGWLYHIWSLSIFLGKCGVTNLGQSISEHDGDDSVSPTISTYWWGNWLLFNTGYHNEHHTFPNVPWNRLPRLKKAAPDIFNRASERSYFGWWWQHVKDDFGATRRNALVNAIDETGPSSDAVAGGAGSGRQPAP